MDEVLYDGDKQLKLTVFPFGSEWLEGMGTIVLIQDISFEISMKNYLVRTEKVSSIAELAAWSRPRDQQSPGDHPELCRDTQAAAPGGGHRLEPSGNGGGTPSNRGHRRGACCHSRRPGIGRWRSWILPSVLDEVLLLVKHKTAEKGIRSEQVRAPGGRARVLRQLEPG
ncbi:MAG: hypothetical protein M0C28_23545 [Candidatus Moduliflexus flocculans]|nr:hypothetical protein [Candidatus Moduliflexus flocculans]